MNKPRNLEKTRSDEDVEVESMKLYVCENCRRFYWKWKYANDCSVSHGGKPVTTSYWFKIIKKVKHGH